MGHRCKEVPTKPMSLPSCYHITKRNAHTHRSLKKITPTQFFLGIFCFGFTKNFLVYLLFPLMANKFHTGKDELTFLFTFFHQNSLKKKKIFFTNLEVPGIEPGAFHLRSERATTALHPHLL